MSTATIDTELLAQIDHLDVGAHLSPEDGICVMEAVAWVAGESFSDTPQCACPVIGAYCRALNDRMPDDQRQRLLPYIVRLAGSRGTVEIERMRGYKAATLALKVFVPLALDVRGLVTRAATLRALPDITDLATARGARTAARVARAAAADDATNADNADNADDADDAYAAYAATNAADAADAATNAAARAAAFAADAAAYAAYAGADADARAATYADAADAAAYAAADAAADAADAADAAANAAAYAARAAASMWDAALAGLDALLAITEEGTR